MSDDPQKVWVLTWATEYHSLADLSGLKDQYGLDFFEQAQILSVLGVYKGLLTAIRKVNEVIREEEDPELLTILYANSFQPYNEGYVYKTGHLSFYVQEMEVDETPWQPGQGVRS